MLRTPSTAGALTLIDLLHNQPDIPEAKRPLSPDSGFPEAKRQFAHGDELDLPFALTSPGSSPQRTCTFSPSAEDLFNQVAETEDLELSPLLLPKMVADAGSSLEAPLEPLPTPADLLKGRQAPREGAEGDFPEPDELGELRRPPPPPLTLLEAVQQNPMPGMLPQPKNRRPASPEAEMLQSHSAWQKKLRQVLGESDATTRALLSPALSRDLYSTVQVLARLSPRQVSSLHASAKELVDRLLDQTRRQVCAEAGLGPPGDWEASVRAISDKTIAGVSEPSGVGAPCSARPE